ncbi:MAG: hypothetical protein GF416_05215 [Candidatus Altiarchaeales archaeon]|nr:hypothetical protein [Candidatus Altiarchaeales archaeon]MBD3416516.1 hypothetical protein [Candidatus Altiarchaeales archaeon]
MDYVKSELSSVDLKFLVRELRELLVGARVDRVYQVGERELAFRMYGKGGLDFISASNFMCVTKYRRPAPRQPSSFAMQLRKNLKGKSVRDVRQHGFDRIVEVKFDEHILVFELFSKGNVILCDSGMKIMGLLDWQKWRDRTLGVGRVYEYPPPVKDPQLVDEDGFREVMSSSEKGVASTLATRFSLGGYYAEKVCGDAGIDPGAAYDEVDHGMLWRAFQDFIDSLEADANPVLEEDNVLPFGGGENRFHSFNEAVDEYFSRMEREDKEFKVEAGIESKRERLEKQLENQLRAYEEASSGVDEERAKGDRLYQRMSELNLALDRIRELKRKGLDDEDIMEELKDMGFIKGLEGHRLKLDL